MNISKAKVSFICIILLSITSVYAYPKMSGYGIFDYRNYQTFKSTNNFSPYFREQMDLTEFAIEAEYELNQGNKFEFEIEIEHGGTGTAYEFEPLEEFGEFESEVEKGGEVVLSELVYFKRMNDFMGVKVGKFPLRIGLGSVMTHPGSVIAPQASYLEDRMIPGSWNEVGVELELKWEEIKSRLAVVNGLNSEFFRTYNWIGGGYQRHFEEINAEDKAFIFNIEYGDVKRTQGVAISYYRGDSSNNRYKKDKLSAEATVQIISGLGHYRIGNWTFLGQYIRGTLENSDQVIEANSTLGGLAKPKSFASLGSAALHRLFQVSYDMFDNWAVYSKYEYVNTFLQVANETVAPLPRYDVVYLAAGSRWIIDENSQLKLEYGVEKTKLENLPETKHYTLSYVMQFSDAE